MGGEGEDDIYQTPIPMAEHAGGPPAGSAMKRSDTGGNLSDRKGEV